MNLNENDVGIVIFNRDRYVGTGDIVKRTKLPVSIRPSFKFLGCVVDPLGFVIDGQRRELSLEVRQSKLRRYLMFNSAFARLDGVNDADDCYMLQRIESLVSEAFYGIAKNHFGDIFDSNGHLISDKVDPKYLPFITKQYKQFISNNVFRVGETCSIFDVRRFFVETIAVCYQDDSNH